MTKLIVTIKKNNNISRILTLALLFLANTILINLFAQNIAYGSISANVDFAVVSDWGTGFTGEITISNTSIQKITNWTLEFDYDQTITSLWNGEMTSNGNHYTVQHPSWSGDIGTNSSVTFGFVVSGSSSDRPTNYRLNGIALDNTSPSPPAPTPTPSPSPTPTPTPTLAPTPTQTPEMPNDGIEFIFTVTDDWGSGFNAEIKIVNNSEQTITNWVLEFDFSHDITNLWNGELTRDGNHYTVRHPSWDPDIDPNSTVSFGFGGSPGNITDEPTGYILNGEFQDVGSGNSNGDENNSGNDTGTNSGTPAKPTISILKDWQNGGFIIEWNKWSGLDATSWELFEDGQLIFEESIQLNNGGQQTGSFHISDKNYGVFFYKVVLVNSGGRTESDEVHYSVDGASLIVIDSIDIGGQALQATIDQGVLTDFTVRMIDNDNPDFVLSTNNKYVITYSVVDNSTIRTEGLKSGRSSIRIEERNTGEVRFLGIRVRDENGNLPGMPDYLAIGSVSEDTQADLDFWKGFSEDDLKNRRMDIRYIYINGGPKNQGVGWRTWTVVDGFRVTSYIRESLKLGMIPFLVYYNIPDGGESYFTDKQHIESLDYMEGYFTDLKFALELALKEAGDELVGFLLEPDFIGYFAQNDGRPEDILASTDAAYSSGALGRGIDPDFPNTLAGLVEAINYTIRKYMPNAYLGWQFNLWASPSGGFTTTIPGNGIIHLTDTLGISPGRTAIINEAGAITDYYIDAGVLTQGANFVSIDKFGLDAGAEGKSDDPSTSVWFWNAVHWTNYLTFVSMMHEKTQLPVILWQIPVGHINESLAFSPYHSDGKFPILENVATRYEDSAPTYFFGDTFIADGNRFIHFTKEDGGISDVSSNGQQITLGSHIDLARDSGVSTILFGAGVGHSTDGVGSPPTDDYWWITKVQEYFGNPVPLE